VLIIFELVLGLVYAGGREAGKLVVEALDPRAQIHKASYYQYWVLYPLGLRPTFDSKMLCDQYWVLYPLGLRPTFDSKMVCESGPKAIGVCIRSLLDFVDDFQLVGLTVNVLLGRFLAVLVGGFLAVLVGGFLAVLVGVF